MAGVALPLRMQVLPLCQAGMEMVKVFTETEGITQKNLLQRSQ